MNKNIRISLLLPAILGIAACTYDPYKTDIPATEATMTLEPSSPAFVLTEENLKDVAITFSWTPARQLSDEYLITYSAALDVLGNNFGSNTAISTDAGNLEYTFNEAEGVYSCSFTGEQIDNWYNDRWGLPVNRDFTLQFRVVASITGGPSFEAPEVCQVQVVGTPVHQDIFAADEMSISGTAIAAETPMEQTLENENLYAWYGALTPGELQIPVEYDGVSYYIHSASGDGTLQDGEAETVVMDETEGHWAITEAGNYRIVVNMVDKTVTIRSPKTDLQPLTVTFQPNGTPDIAPATITVTDLWAYGAGTGWGAKELNVTQSMADPQVLVYSGDALSGNMKFVISNGFESSDGTSYTKDNCYCYGCPLTEDGLRQTYSIPANKVSELGGGADREARESYIGIPANTNFIIFDLRNMTIFASNRTDI